MQLDRTVDYSVLTPPGQSRLTRAQLMVLADMTAKTDSVMFLPIDDNYIPVGAVLIVDHELETPISDAVIGVADTLSQLTDSNPHFTGLLVATHHTFNLTESAAHDVIAVFDEGAASIRHLVKDHILVTPDRIWAQPLRYTYTQEGS
jgi:hypothetical protein